MARQHHPLAVKDCRTGAGFSVTVGDALCTMKKRHFRMLPVCRPMQLVVSMWAACACTEMGSLLKRVQPDPTLPQSQANHVRRARRQFARVMARERFRATRLSFSAFLARAPSSKRKLYENAIESLKQQPLTWKDARVSMFAKAEYRTTSLAGGPATKPRAIQARSPRFNAAFGVYTKAVYDVLMKWKGPKGRVRQRTRIFRSGMTPRQLGAAIAEKRAQFKNPVVFNLDANSFDRSVDGDDLRMVDNLYRTIFGGDQELNAILALRHGRRIVNRGKSSKGLKYRVVANRMSGDMDTSLGNSLLTFYVVLWAMLKHGIRKWDCMIEGDDCLLFLEAGSLTEGQINAAYADLGWLCASTKALHLHEIDFCRGTFITLADGVRHVRQAKRALSTLTCCWRSNTDQEYRRMLKGKALGELAMARGVPCLQALCSAILKATGDVKAIMVDTRMHGVKLAKLRLDGSSLPVTRQARVEYEMAFGITVAQQTTFEQRIESHIHNILNTGDKFINEDMPGPGHWAQAPWACFD